MEALVAVSAAALTIYDMCKALDKSMEITGIYLIEKTGGKSGDYLRANLPESAVPQNVKRNERSQKYSRVGRGR